MLADALSQVSSRIMTQPDVQKYLADIQASYLHIQDFTQGQTIEDYREDVKTQAAVERQFEIIGEAVSQMIQAVPEMERALSDASKIVAFRDYLLHGYASVSYKLVWGFLEGSLPRLIREVEALLSEAN
jgi:uncharacterized protein with HEPN domain